MSRGFVKAFDWAIVTVCFLAVSRLAQAEHFDIKLNATGSDQIRREAYADDTPPASGLNPRPLLKVRTGEKITFQFVMTNVNPHGYVKGAGVHYYVAREKEAGQKAPHLEQPVIEGSFTLDLKPRASVGVREQVVIHNSGTYLLRVESLRTQRDHEHFSAIDVEVK